MRLSGKEQGYTLIELVLVILILGIMAAIAMKSLGQASDAVRTEETRQELTRIAHAIAGNPNLVSGGTRTDYGYVGDVGSLPASLNNLNINPGGYSTWQGPYLYDPVTGGSPTTDFSRDAWGEPYQFSGGNSIVSVGGPQPLSQQIAPSTDDLLYNRVMLTIIDRALTPPGADFIDSLEVALTRPNGSGGYTQLVKPPAADGSVTFDSIPIGLHRIDIVYTPTNDTMVRLVSVDPGSESYLELQLPQELF